MELDQFVKLLVQSGVMNSEEIAAFLQSLPADKTPQNGSELAGALVKQGRLTRYQVQRIGNRQGQGLVFGEYVILDEIGAGGMGQVFKARHRRMKREVAVKFLPAKALKAPGAVERFQREVEAAARLNHPNIVMAFDAGEHAGQHFLVMEYVAGSDLSSHLKRQGLLPVELVLDYTIQAARGLEYAHKAGVIHRDIKPSNLLLDNHGTVKILDMGLARLEADAAREELTATGQVMGTVHYMPPEQARSVKSADHRADIYSLGCTLYTLLTGEPAYNGETVVEILMAHQNQPIPSLRAARPDVPEWLDTVLRKMLAKSPQDRIPSMSEVIRELNAGRSLQATPSATEFTPGAVSTSAPATISTSTGTLPQTGQKLGLETLTGTLEETQGYQTQSATPGQNNSTWKRKQRSPWKLIAGGAVSLLLIVIATLYLSGIIFKVETPAGTILLEVDDPSAIGATVTVDGQRKINIQTADSPTPIEVTADEKTHTLKVSKEGFETFTKEFTAKSGKQQTIRVRLEPPKVVTTPPGPGKNPIPPPEQPAKPLAFTQPGFEEWVREVRKLSAEEQVQAVAKKLQEHNPDFDGKVTPLITERQVTNLSFSGSFIKDISPIRALPELRRLFCPGTGQMVSPLSDLSPLRGMRLTDLKCNHTSVSDLSPLSGMRLNYLDCYSTPVSDLSPLEGMPLEYLYIALTSVSDLSPLKGMRLSVLYANGTRIADLSPLTGMPLQALGIEKTRVTDLSPLAGMQLTRLEAYNAAFSDLSPLKGMPLESLTFSPLHITQGIDAVRGIASLKTVGAHAWTAGQQLPASEFWKKYDAGEFGKPAGAKPLAFTQPGFEEWVQEVRKLPENEQVQSVAKKLQELNPGFDGTVKPQFRDGLISELGFVTDSVTDISPVRALAGLKSLRASGTGLGKGVLADLSPLEGMDLTLLECRHNRVPDLSPLQAMPLTKLFCDNNLLRDLSPLRGMELTELWCNGNKISDLSPLQGMPLTFLNCSHNYVSDLAPLKSMPLNFLKANNTGVSDLTPLQGMPLKNLNVGHTAVKDPTPLKGLPLEVLYLSNSPLSQLPPLESLPLRHLWYDLPLFHAPSEKLLRDLPLKTLNGDWLAGQPVQEHWKEFDTRKKAAEAFAAETAKLSPQAQVQAVAAKLKELNAGQLSVLETEPEIVAVTTLTLGVESGVTAQAYLEVTPLRAFSGLRKLTIREGVERADLSPLNSLPLEDLVCSKGLVEKNLTVLREMTTLKTINGQPAKEYLDGLAVPGPQPANS